MSELLRRIEAQIQSSSDFRVQGELKARRACYLARIGRFSEAKETIAELRRTSTGAGFERVTIWVILVEGVLAYFESLGRGAQDRIMRAQVLSKALKDTRLVLIASAWRSHIEFESSNFLAMRDSLAEVFLNPSVDAEDDESLARASLTLAYSFTLVGDRKTAQFWFSKAREHALRIGDQATIEAVIHNRASFHLAYLRIKRCFEELGAQEIDDCRLAIASAKNFQTLIDIGSLTTLTELCEARLKALGGHYEEAERLLLELRGRQPFASNNYSVDIIDIERAFLLASSGRSDRAQEILQHLSDPSCSMLDPDDRMVAAWMRMKTALMNSPVPDGDPLLSEFDARRNEFLQYRERLQEAIRPFASLAEI